MNDNVRRAMAGFAAFVVVCVASAFALLAVFAQLRFGGEETFRAEFNDVNGLAKGDFVRVAGVEVGKVKGISINGASRALVEFTTAPSVVLTQATRAAIHWADPIGTRYLALLEGAGAPKRLHPGDTIPVERTVPPLDLDTLLGGFRPLFRALDPQQVNQLSGQLIQAFQGEGVTISSFLNQTAAVTSTLADRETLIEQVITNLNGVLQTFGGQQDQLAKGVDSLSQLVKALAERKGDISNAVAYTNASSGTVADLLNQAHPAFKSVVAQSDRASSIVVGDHVYFDDFLNTLPDSYLKLVRLGLSGDYFTFYLCEIFLKVNGKGGQPVYVKVAGQDSGRCAPR